MVEPLTSAGQPTVQPTAQPTAQSSFETEPFAREMMRQHNKEIQEALDTLHYGEYVFAHEYIEQLRGGVHQPDAERYHINPERAATIRQMFHFQGAEPR